MLVVLRRRLQSDVRQRRVGSGFAIWMFACRTLRGRDFARWWPLPGLSVMTSTSHWKGSPFSGPGQCDSAGGEWVSQVASVGPAQRLATSPRETESAPDIAALLRRLVDAAVVGFSGAAHACVTLSGGGGPSTVVFSDALALTMDCRQYKSGQGPCPEAAAGTPVVGSNDLTGETRWQSFSPVAVASGIGSVVCFGLGARGRWFGSRVCTARGVGIVLRGVRASSALAAVASLAGCARRERRLPLASRWRVGM